MQSLCFGPRQCKIISLEGQNIEAQVAHSRGDAPFRMSLMAPAIVTPVPADTMRTRSKGAVIVRLSAPAIAPLAATATPRCASVYLRLRCPVWTAGGMLPPASGYPGRPCKNTLSSRTVETNLSCSRFRWAPKSRGAAFTGVATQPTHADAKVASVTDSLNRFFRATDATHTTTTP
jgi:hypothetical protein